MITERELRILASLEGSIAYNSRNKAAFQRLSMKLCRSIRTELELTAAAADVRFNAGGIAVSGEAILHTNSLYLQVFESALGGPLQILYRTCKGRRDYTGGMNHFASVARIAEEGIPRFVSHLQALLAGGFENPVWNGAEYRKRSAETAFGKFPRLQ